MAKRNTNTRAAFSLIELLVSIAIIAIITGLSMAAYGKFTAKAQNTRCVELVHQARTALEHIYQRDGAWPRPLLAEAKGSNGKLDKVAGAALAKAGVMSLTYREITNPNGTKSYRLDGLDHFGVVSPWAMDYIKHHADERNSAAKLPAGGTIESHILRFAVDGGADDKYDGITVVAHGYNGGKVNVRAQACVWSYGRDGQPNTKDDIRSWSKGQEVE